MTAQRTLSGTMSGAMLGGGSRFARLQRMLFWVTIALFVAAAIALTWRAGHLFAVDLAPEVSLKGRVLARSLEVQIERALNLGIPLRQLKGMNEFLDDFLVAHPEVAYVAVTSPGQRIVYGRGPALAEIKPSIEAALAIGELTRLTPDASAGYYNTRMVLEQNNVRVASLHIGIRADYVQQRMLEIGADAVIVLFVCVLMAFEVLTLLMTAGLRGRIESVMLVLREIGGGNFSQLALVRGHDEVAHLARRVNQLVVAINRRVAHLQRAAQRQGDAAVAQLQQRWAGYRFSTAPLLSYRPSLEAVRVPLFLFVLSEELSRSFLPIYARELASDLAGIPPDIVVSLPICVYMLLFAIATPFAGTLADRYGNRRIFMLGSTLAAVGFSWLAFAGSFWQLVVARALCAAGYSVATIAMQTYLVTNAPAGGQARAQALFVGGVMLAGMAGASLGGVLAERIGFRYTFLISAAAAVLGYLTFMLSPDTSEKFRPAATQVRIFRLMDFVRLLTQRQFAGLMLFAAVPSKILLAGFLFYLTPLYLQKLGFTQSDIGRSVMLYFLLVYFGNYLASWLADRYNLRWSLVISGGALAGAGLLSIAFLRHESSAVLLAIAGLGLGTAVSTAPMMAIATDIFGKNAPAGSTSVIVVVRMLERVGSFVGPLLAAVAVALSGYRGAIITIGLLGLMCALALWSSALLARRTERLARTT